MNNPSVLVLVFVHDGGALYSSVEGYDDGIPSIYYNMYYTVPPDSSVRSITPAATQYTVDSCQLSGKEQRRCPSKHAVRPTDRNVVKTGPTT